MPLPKTKDPWAVKACEAHDSRASAIGARGPQDGAVSARAIAGFTSRHPFQAVKMTG